MPNEITLLFQIKPSSGTPIYRQIIDQIKRLVISGYLKPGDELPSVRQVAGSLEVNPMTISKAYSMLEETGYLERIRGKAMKVSKNHIGESNITKRLELIRPTLDEIVIQSNQLGLSKEEIISELIKLWRVGNE